MFTASGGGNLTGRPTSAETLVDYLKQAGFTKIAVYGDCRMAPPEAGEQRIYIKARKGIIK